MLICIFLCFTEITCIFTILITFVKFLLNKYYLYQIILLSLSMASESNINGVTKIGRASGVFTYLFPICRVIADNNLETVSYFYNFEYNMPFETVQFADISPNYAATTPEEYVDELCALNVFTKKYSSIT